MTSTSNQTSQLSRDVDKPWRIGLPSPAAFSRSNRCGSAHEAFHERFGPLARAEIYPSLRTAAIGNHPIRTVLKVFLHYPQANPTGNGLDAQCRGCRSSRALGSSLGGNHRAYIPGLPEVDRRSPDPSNLRAIHRVDDDSHKPPKLRSSSLSCRKAYLRVHRRRHECRPLRSRQWKPILSSPFELNTAIKTCADEP